jgi:hypothetical protein
MTKEKENGKENRYNLSAARTRKDEELTKLVFISTEGNQGQRRG